MKKHKQYYGFTLVELLIVIVIIAILAAITVVSYNGLTTRARKSQVQAALAQAVRKVALQTTVNGGTYPPSLATAGLLSTDQGGITYNYIASSNGYCISASLGSVSFMAHHDNRTPAEGSCAPTASAPTASSQNGTAEGIVKAFDGVQTTKWLAWSTSPWTVFSPQTPATPNGYVLTSANDYPERDPKAWTLYGSNDGSTWTALDSQTAQVFSARYEKKSYSFTNTQSYAMFKLAITQNNGSADITQIADITLTASGSSIPIFIQ